MSRTSVPPSRPSASQSTVDPGSPGGRWALTTATDCVTPRAVTGMPASDGTARAALTPGTTSTGMPASTQAATSSIPRANTCTSPPLSRTTRSPRRACSTSSASMSPCRHDGPRAALADLDHLGALGQVDGGRQPVAHDDVRTRQQAPAADGEQAGVARAAADQGDRARARPTAPQRQLAGLQGQGEGVAQTYRAPGVAARAHRHHDVVDAGHGGHPGRRPGGVVGPDAPGAARLAVGGDLLVDHAGGRHHQPGAVEVGRGVRTPVHRARACRPRPPEPPRRRRRRPRPGSRTGAARRVRPPPPAPAVPDRSRCRGRSGAGAGVTPSGCQVR